MNTMCILFLNDMRSAKFENVEPVAKATTKEELKAMVQRLRVPGYSDGRWGKGFRAGSALEWFNGPVASFGAYRCYHIGDVAPNALAAIPNASDIV